LNEAIPTASKRPVAESRILVVDDDRAHRGLLVRFLERSGFSAIEAASGVEGLAAIAAGRADLVLLDLKMPEMDGDEVLRQIRAQFESSILPVIIFTGLDDREQAIQAFQAGANDFVLKPIDSGILLARVEVHLRLAQAKLALKESEERYARATRGTNDGLWDWNLKSNSVFYSSRWMEILGLESNDTFGTPDIWINRIHDDDRLRVMVALEAHDMGASGHFETEFRMLHRDGVYRWMLCRGVAQRDAEGAAQRIAGSLSNITERKTADPLTGLPNRLILKDRIQTKIDRGANPSEKSFALLYLDIDNFKLVNDGLGHAAGDELLVSIARRLETSVRSHDSIVARLGGDEFAILLEDVPNLAKPFFLQGHELVAQASIGIAFGSSHDQKADNLLRNADIAMYQAKAAGRNTHRVFDAEMHRQLTEQLALENDVRHALERNEFELHYQPIYELASGGISGFEALLRWNHPHLGAVSPETFIPIIEAKEWIDSIGQWTLETACKQLARWNCELSPTKPLTLHVNVAQRQLSNPQFVEACKSTFERSQVSASQVVLELTETALIRNVAQSMQALSALRAIGVRIAVDDFGIQNSSLSALCQLPLDMLKVDGAFLDRINESQHNDTIVKMIVSLATLLNLDTVAEGIETEAQRQLVQELGCRFGQGYLLSGPVTVQAATEMLEKAGNTG
jgi:diguanylate cyclase (GGDEF)-like protein/PAS domain S-box-containing protein